MKETINKTKRQLTEWEKIFASDVSEKRLISKIYKELIQLNFKNTNNLFKEWACIHAKSLQLCQTLCHPMDCSLPCFSVHGDSPGKNIGVGCHALLQGIFLTQGSNQCLLSLLHWQAGSLPLAPPGKP